MTHLQAGSLPRNTVALTFDDGYQEIYREILPLLKRFQCPATVFLTVDFIDNSVVAWWDELWAWVQAFPEKRMHWGKRVFSLQNFCEKMAFLKFWQNRLKQMPESVRQNIFNRLRKQFSPDSSGKKIDYFLESGQIPPTGAGRG